MFLIFIGGILILFIYISSLSSNEKISFSFGIFIKNFSLFCLIPVTLIFDNFFLPKTKNTDLSKLNEFIILINENHINISKLYETPNNWITIILILYLLLTLIIVVKITNSFIGPLRQKN